ncbi:hypothetical protein BLA29_003169 [Euroglyphus maynei]|uniref:Piwi domain-containing protein n=1 Tax=Euroglyphus maynei TaxID=6958 RepID=A0A1Y3AYF8_EURMA|nr:hypothetical protein BLA29_003169 [Euroglyphus maynei]
MKNLKILDINFVLIGLSKHSRIDKIFEKIKCHATSDHGLVTQIFLLEKLLLNEQNSQFYDSLAIKSCLKVGGQPNIIDMRYWNVFPFDPESTMVVGTSFYHFKLDNIGQHLFSHSIVTSMDRNFSQYVSMERVSTKPNDKNIFEKIFRNLLQEYHKEHGKYPQNIILFHGKKYTDLKPVVVSFDKQIKVTSFSIDKYSPIRLFKNDGEKVPIGTSVNLDFQQSILDRSVREFAICNQIGAESVRYKTTKYVVINDDVRMSENHIKHVCYAMCHYYFDNFCVNDVPFPLELAQQFAKKAARRCIGRNEANPLDSIEEIVKNFSGMVRVHENLEYSIDE